MFVSCNAATFIKICTFTFFFIFSQTKKYQIYTYLHTICTYRVMQNHLIILFFLPSVSVYLPSFKHLVFQLPEEIDKKYSFLITIRKLCVSRIHYVKTLRQWGFDTGFLINCWMAFLDHFILLDASTNYNDAHYIKHYNWLTRSTHSIFF